MNSFQGPASRFAIRNNLHPDDAHFLKTAMKALDDATRKIAELERRKIPELEKRVATLERAIG